MTEQEKEKPFATSFAAMRAPAVLNACFSERSIDITFALKSPAEGIENTTVTMTCMESTTRDMSGKGYSFDESINVLVSRFLNAIADDVIKKRSTPEEKAFRDKHKLTLCGE